MRSVMMGPSKEDVDMSRQELETQIESGESEEDQGFMSLVSGAQVSPKVLVGLVSALNKVLPLFGLPSLQGKELSPELVRALSMAAQAISDAVASEEAPSELEFSIDEIKGGDQAVIVIAGKLDRLSKTPSFRKFLKAKPLTPADQKPAGDQVAIEKTADQGADIEALFASRL